VLLWRVFVPVRFANTAASLANVSMITRVPLSFVGLVGTDCVGKSNAAPVFLLAGTIFVMAPAARVATEGTLCPVHSYAGGLIDGRVVEMGYARS